MRMASRLFVALIVVGSATCSFAADRSADEIVKEITAIPQPKTHDEYLAGKNKKAELIGELYQTHPDDARLARLLPVRWEALWTSRKSDEALAEIDKILATTKVDSLKKDGAYAKVEMLLMDRCEGDEPILRAFDECTKLAPGDHRMPNYVYSMTRFLPRVDPRKIALEDRIVRDYSNSHAAAIIKGIQRQRDSIGKPFDLEFTEATHGTHVSIKGLKGKVVVIHFWTTWPDACVDEVLKMKPLYAAYKDKGVEFIGVSLDRPKEVGGLDSLKRIVVDKGITWPQYYQGNGWESKFSSSWGIGGLPWVFIVDADGNLATVEAHGQLDTLIPELLKKAKPGHVVP